MCGVEGRGAGGGQVGFFMGGQFAIVFNSQRKSSFPRWMERQEQTKGVLSAFLMNGRPMKFAIFSGEEISTRAFSKKTANSAPKFCAKASACRRILASPQKAAAAAFFLLLCQTSKSWLSRNWEGEGNPPGSTDRMSGEKGGEKKPFG